MKILCIRTHKIVKATLCKKLIDLIFLFKKGNLKVNWAFKHKNFKKINKGKAKELIRMLGIMHTQKCVCILGTPPGLDNQHRELWWPSAETSMAKEYKQQICYMYMS